MALSGDTVVVGNPRSSGDGKESGAAELLTLSACNADGCSCPTPPEKECTRLRSPAAPVNGQCQVGEWKFVDSTCDPFGGGCDDLGDGLCYQLCESDADCVDPCRRNCAPQPLYKSTDFCSTGSEGPRICSPTLTNACAR